MTEKEEVPILTWDLEGKVWIDPTEALEYERKKRGSPKRAFPKCCVICYQKHFVDLAIKKFHAQPIEYLFYSDLYNLSYKKCLIGIIQSGIGAPMAALIVEWLIARGVKYILNIGTAGCLQYDNFNPGDIVLCTKALRNEGTSYYYLRPSKFVFPDEELTAQMESILKKQRRPYRKGPTITIDAPYRFSISQAKELRKEGILTSEMEAAAVFAVCKFRRISSAAAFVISDLATENFEWEPRFYANELKKGMDNLFTISLDTFNSMK